MTSTLPVEAPAAVFGLLFLAILVAPVLAERARIPGIIGLIAAGIALGPDGAGLLAREGTIAALGGVGLLYLMFVAGLDLDLDGFARDRRDSIVFGIATFVFPMVIVTAACLWLIDLGPAASVILATAFSSHTLLTLPLAQRFGLLRNRAVTATLGGTLVVTVAALLVLAVAAAASGGSSLLFWVLFPLGLVAFTAATVVGLPRLTRWFFAGLGHDRSVRLAFVMVALFAASLLASAVRIEPIVGAFLAGLALNRFVPPGTRVDERIHFLGDTLFVPVFLISTGMLIDPVRLATDPQILTIGGILAVAALGSKALAAAVTARILGFSWPEMLLSFSLSSGQAAGALAAAIVADDLGLIGQPTVNGVVLVILVSALVSSATATRSAPRVSVPAGRDEPLGRTVVVPVANPASAGSLIRFAALLAGPDSGSVIPVNVLGFDATRAQVDEHRRLTEDAESVALRHGAEARSIVRVDSTTTAGILHTIVEQGATAMLVGWKGYTDRRTGFFGSVIDGLISGSPVPVAVCHPGIDEEVRRIVLSVTHHDLSTAGDPGLRLAVAFATRMAQQADVPLVVVTEDDPDEVRAHLPEDRRERTDIVVDERRQSIALRHQTSAGDVVLMGVPPTAGRLDNRAIRVGRAIRDRTVIVAVPR
ncbi:MAG: cation:proton antiporter [Actinobacteria bacterium]|nr:cation:proton antiporter [Actinomycetota bacterium]